MYGMEPELGASRVRAVSRVKWLPVYFCRVLSFCTIICPLNLSPALLFTSGGRYALHSLVQMLGGQFWLC